MPRLITFTLTSFASPQPVVLKFGINHITELVENRTAKLVRACARLHPQRLLHSIVARPLSPARVTHILHPCLPHITPPAR